MRKSEQGEESRSGSQSGPVRSLLLSRPDGFAVVHAGIGWDLYAPAVELGELGDAIEELLVCDRRRRRPEGSYLGPERRGAWFAWVEQVEDADARIDEEKRLGLFHGLESDRKSSSEAAE